MTYTTAVKPATSAQEQALITIEFAPTIQTEESEYSYEHPQFVFGDVVNLSNPGLNYPSIQYTVCALELVESKTNQGRLLNQPRWKYKISDGEKTLWKDESALIRHHDQQSTCKGCPKFNDYQDSEGRGWCNEFNLPAKTDHFQTNNCVLNLNDTKEFEEAFITEVIELDREGYPMSKDTVANAYFDPNFVSLPNEPF